MKQEHERASSASLVLAPQRATGEPYTTSEIIAAGTGINHRRVRDAIRKYQSDLEAFGVLGAYQTKTPNNQEGGRNATGYILTEQQATFLLTLLKNTPVVVAFKKELVRQFYTMRSLLLERASPVWQDARSLGKEIRRQEAEAIKRLVDYAAAQGSRNAGMYYVNLSRLADATVGIVERDKAQVVQLTALLLVEQTIAREIMAGIGAGEPYWAIYQAIKDRLSAFPAMGVPAACGHVKGDRHK